MNFEIVATQNQKILADLIAKQFNKVVIEPHIIRFADSEIEVIFASPEKLANKIVFIVQSTNTPVHDNLMQLLLMVHKVKAAGAQKIVGVIPYFGYSRHDSIHADKTKGSLELIARMISAAGIDELITLEFHAPEIHEFFSIPVHNIKVIKSIATHCKATINLEDGCIVSPDKGSAGNAQMLSNKLGIDYIGFVKERYEPDKTRIVQHIGQTNAKTAVIVDDIIDTGDTALNVCYELHQMGFTHIYGYFTHPVLSGDAVQLIEHSYFDKIFVSNSIELDQASEKIEQFDITGLIIEKIKELTI